MAPLTAAAAQLIPRVVPVTPSEERWRAMTPAEREHFVVAVNEALSDPLIAMSEGRPHKKAKSRAIDMLGLHFRAMGRRIYLAEELSVLYPGARGFTPDVLAVLDVEEPEDDQRMAWVVADEGKGLDWVLDVLWAGDRKKDLEDNVVLYASLGIPEYFVYDQRQQRILGYRLPPGAKRYQPILAQSGLYRSEVLGLDLAILDRSLRFFEGTAELYDTTALIRRFEGIVANLQERAEQATRDTEKATRDAEKATRDTESAQREAASSRAAMRGAILSVLTMRGIACSAEALARIEGCDDAAVLQRWLEGAVRATSEAELFRA